MDNKEHIIYLDVIRVVACFFVIIVHVSANHLGIHPVTSINFQLSAVYNTLSITSPAIFFMISGALFLNPKSKDIPVRKLWCKYIFRMAVSYVFWSYLFTLIIWFPHYTWSLETLKLYIKEFFVGVPMYHMWFIPAIIAIYMILPLLKPAFADQGRCRYFLMLFLVFQIIIPTILKFDIPYHDILNNLYSRIPFVMCIGYLGYFVLGYYLSAKDFSKRIRYIIYAVGILGIVTAFVLNGYISVSRNTNKLVLSDLFALNSALFAAAVYVAFRYIPWKRGRLTTFVAKLSGLTFGIYLIHPLCLSLLLEHCPFFVQLPTALGIPLIAAIVFTFCAVIVGCLSKIPFVNKYLI